MNSFEPMTVENAWDKPSPVGFSQGWREYRIPVAATSSIPAGKVRTLEFVSLVCDRAEFYQDGEMILSAENLNRSPLSVPLRDASASFEVRMLLKAREGVASGICVTVTQSVADKK